MKAPILRFKNYNDLWKNTKLDSLIIKLKSGLSRQLNNKDIGIPVIRANNIEKGRLDFSDVKYWYKVDPQGAKVENYYVSSGDILINFINSEAKMGTSAIVREPLYRNMIYTTNILLMQTNEKLNNYFFFTYTQVNKYKYFIKSITKPAVNQASFTTVDYKNMMLFIPSITEQQKIADFFTLLDRRIEKQQEKVEALREYKKGMLQKIFSRELRFKDENGDDFEGWEYKKLNDFAEKITRKNKGFLVKNVISNSSKFGLIPQKDYFDKDIANKDNIDGYYVISKGNFVYNPRISNDAPYGPVSTYIYDDEGVVSPLYLCFKVEGISKGFLSYFFKSDLWYKHIYLNGDSGARHDRVSIKDKEFFELSIPYPCSKEQQKITDFLSKLDEKIEKEESKLEAFQEQKKGFMQQMFI